MGSQVKFKQEPNALVFHGETGVLQRALPQTSPMDFVQDLQIVNWVDSKVRGKNIRPLIVRRNPDDEGHAL